MKVDKLVEAMHTMKRGKRTFTLQFDAVPVKLVVKKVSDAVIVLTVPPLQGYDDCIELIANFETGELRLNDYYVSKTFPSKDCAPIAHKSFFKFMRQLADKCALAMTLEDVSTKQVGSCTVPMEIFVLAGERTFYDKVAGFDNPAFYETFAVLRKGTLKDLKDWCVEVLKGRGLEAKEQYDRYYANAAATLDELDPKLKGRSLQTVAKACIASCQGRKSAAAHSTMNVVRNTFLKTLRLPSEFSVRFTRKK